MALRISWWGILRVSGFTFVSNAVRLDFPVVECIRSVLPMVDEFVVAVGVSDDGTEELIRSIGDEKIFVVPTRWNPNLRSGGYVLAQQTNVALFNCTGHWAVYIQADEAVHEQDHALLRSLMQKYADDDRVESLALRRRNFVGDYRTISQPTTDICVRVVKPHRFVMSRGDAAGFTVHPKYKEKGRRIATVDTGVALYHYADVRSWRAIAAKGQSRVELWQAPNYAAEEVSLQKFYASTYTRRFLSRFDGSHPATMRERIAARNFAFDIDSPAVRTALNRHERRLAAKDFLYRKVSRVFRMGAGSARLIATEPPA